MAGSRALVGVFLLAAACGQTSSPQPPASTAPRAAVAPPLGPASPSSSLAPRRAEGCRGAAADAAAASLSSPLAPRALAMPEAPAWPPRAPPHVETDWCTEVVRGLDAATCFFLPETPTRTLLIYLHGVVPPEKSSPQKTHYQAVVVNAARRAGVAALLPRGKQGLAPKGIERWWGWPTSPSAYRRHAGELVERILGARRTLEESTGIRFERVYLAGSSSGAYFVSTLAQRGAIEVDGFGAMSGGATVLHPDLEALPARPVYIGYGLYDTVGESARELGRLLQKARWPVRVAEHRVGHGAREVYLDEAFAFWAEHRD